MNEMIGSHPPENSTWVRGKRIGKGSFGTVDVGVDRADGRVFAVKSVAISSATAAQVEAIENEIRILRSLSSPFIVDYYADDVTAAELAYRNLHMEYLGGGTAAELDGADEDLVRKYAWCVTSALRHLHERGIIHCDVKGRNVLLGPTPGVAKLADFGSAKVAEDDRRAGVAPRGSPLWMAPEVVRGESQGYAADVWALGCTVIEMVTGAPVWRDEGADTLRRIGYSDELPRLPARLSELGRDFVEKCLRRDPCRRWSCDQLLQHPFLKVESTVQIGGLWTPRSVIEWPRLEVSDDEEEDVVWGSGATTGKDRIGKLAGQGGANWESDGWFAVRGVLAAEDGGRSGGGEVGTSVEFRGVESEFQVMRRGVNSGPAVKNEGGGELMLYVIMWMLLYNSTNCLLSYDCAFQSKKFSPYSPYSTTNIYPTNISSAVTYSLLYRVHNLGYHITISNFKIIV